MTEIAPDIDCKGMVPRIAWPTRLRFGVNAATRIVDDLVESGHQQVFIIHADVFEKWCEDLRVDLQIKSIYAHLYSPPDREPLIEDLTRAADVALSMCADAVVGIGGGSVLDMAKLVAASLDHEQSMTACFGTDKLPKRNVHLACVPTTAGTGSEVSPNAILTDERDHLKKGVVSPWLVPDATYVDPGLTVTLPASLTASTGLDALTHCIEAYANRFAHPLVDPYALEGIRLIGANLERACAVGDDLDARAAMLLGSLYGGMCLGPVNTGAVHALAYPLGGEYQIPHGVSNAVLLPHVMSFNLTAAPHRYARIAEMLGVPQRDNPEATAQAGIDRIQEMCLSCGIPRGLTQLGIPPDAVPRLAVAALKVQRLLVRNVRKVTLADAEEIYRKAMQ